ncbi:hypothetical protein ER308_12280 [Egibacter rhizosphaerae]|uniref:Serine kinase n=1 Tax=Egibacter rhizosphaerae TaxID=1670831 RepID=A0A411YGF8_9ACTN|nr:hypothetical protein [Egibacter rhizosphaerae]QBI20266.1 hypothetical protein ER308_12280 [Egibacter rhizosphaerae]
MRTFHLFGRTVATEVPFTTPLVPSTEAPDLTYHLTTGTPDVPNLGPVLHAQPPVIDGVHFAYVHRAGEAYLLRFSKVADFYLWPDRVVCHLRDIDVPWLAELRLLGPVMAFWLELQGEIALHAASITAGEGAVAIASTNGGGKTSLAVELLRAGHALLSDDITPLRADGGHVVAGPGYPQLRLWPDDVAREFGDPDDFRLAHPLYSKRRVPVGGDGFGTHLPRSRPLRALYVLERDPRIDEGGIEVTPLAGADVMRELLRHSFVGSYVDGAGVRPERLATLTHVAGAVPMRRVTHAVEPGTLAKRVREDFAGLARARQ